MERKIKKVFSLSIILLLFVFQSTKALSGNPFETKTKTKFPISYSLGYGIGASSIGDSYLSNSIFSGVQHMLSLEAFKYMKVLGREKSILNFHSSLKGGNLRPKSKSSNIISLMFDLGTGLYSPVFENDKFRTYVGADASANIGGSFRMMSANNLGSAKASVDLQPGILCFYSWKQVIFRMQATANLIGIDFYPNYTESYYEIFVLKNAHKTIRISSPFNKNRINFILSCNFPIFKTYVQLGYQTILINAKINNLRYFYSNHIFSLSVPFTINYYKK